MSTQPTAAAFAESALPPRPLLRGWFHLCAAFLAAAGVVALLLLAHRPSAYVGSAIFGASLILLYGTSASYHRIMWGRVRRNIVKRLDHAMIFVLIAGTYTPFCLRLPSRPWGISMLSVVWGIAGAGILLKLAWPNAPRWLSVACYVGLGWMSLIAAPALVHWLPPAALALLPLGGAIYTVGGVVYALARPDPWPRVFGYHEIFHLMTILGSAVHYSLVVYVVR